MEDSSYHVGGWKIFQVCNSTSLVRHQALYSAYLYFAATKCMLPAQPFLSSGVYAVFGQANAPNFIHVQQNVVMGLPPDAVPAALTTPSEGEEGSPHRLLDLISFKPQPFASKQLITRRLFRA